MSVAHHDGLFVDRVDDGINEEIDGLAADFSMRMNNVTLAMTALDMITREVKRLSEFLQKVNGGPGY